MLRLTGSMDMNEVTRASWYDDSAVRYSIPVNARRPRYNANLNMTYIQALNRKKSLNLTVTPKAFFSAGTMYVSDGSVRGIDTKEFDYTEMMSWFYGDADGSEFSSGYNRPDWLLNLRLAKSIGSFTISLTAHDILGTSKSFSHMASAEYVEDTYRNNLGRCILVGLSYNFGTLNFRKQSRMEMLERRSNL